MTLLVPVLSTKFLKGWPGYPDTARDAITYFPLDEAMRRQWQTDAHTAQWSAPSIGRRLCAGAPETAPGGVRMVVVIFDVDGPGHVCTDAWWAVERGKVFDLFHDVQGFAYRTKGGYRLVFRLSVPFIIRDDSDAAAWSKLYRAWCRHLLRRYAIQADHVVDWQRLFRLPRVVRDSEAQEFEMMGDPNPDAWSPQLSAEDLAVDVEDEAAATRVPAPSARRKTSPGTFNEISIAAEKWLRNHGATPIEICAAADKWNVEHPATWPKRHGLCPICGYRGGFGYTPKKPWLWFCWNTDHPAGAGFPSKGASRAAFVGDALAIAAYERGLSRIDVLRADGYLEDALDVEAKRRGCSRVDVLRKDGYLRRRTAAARRPDFTERLERVTHAMRAS